MGRQIASEINACRSHNIQIRTNNSHNQQKNQLAFHSRRSINMKKTKNTHLASFLHKINLSKSKSRLS